MFYYSDTIKRHSIFSYRILIIICTFILLSVTVNKLYASTNHYSDLLQDMSEKQAQVVYVDNGSAYLNKGSKDNIKVGSLFVLTEAQVISNVNDNAPPVTINKRIGIYRVIQSKSKLSVISPIETSRDIKKGDTVILNHNLKAVFIDTTGQAENTFIKLRNELPNLVWINYKSSLTKDTPQADLYFFAESGAVSIRDKNQQLLDRYLLSGALSGDTPSLLAASAPVLSSAHKQDNISQPLGTMDHSVVASDFIMNGNNTYIITTDGSSLRVYSTNNGLNLITTLKERFPGTVINVKWWAPRPDMPLKAVVSIWKDKQLSHQNNRLESYILSFDQRKLTITHRNIPYLLNTFDFNKGVKKDRLLAQSYSNTRFFGNNIKEVKLNTDKVIYEDLSIELPKGFTVTGSAIEDLNGDNALDIITINDGELTISSGEEIKLRRQSGYGGSLVSVLYELEPELRDTLHETVSFELAAVSLDIDKDGAREFIAPRVYDKPFGFSFGSERNYEYGFDAFYIDNKGQFKSIELPINVFGRIQGMAVINQQLLLLISDVESSKGNGGETRLMSYPF